MVTRLKRKFYYKEQSIESQMNIYYTNQPGYIGTLVITNKFGQYRTNCYNRVLMYYSFFLFQNVFFFF